MSIEHKPYNIQDIWTWIKLTSIAAGSIGGCIPCMNDVVASCFLSCCCSLSVGADVNGANGADANGADVDAKLRCQCKW